MPCECGICGKVFNHSSNLIVHQRVHTRHGLTSAANVGKPTVINPRLFSMRVSTPEKGLMSAVNVGNTSATSSDSFMLGVHTGTRPYECIACGKFFSQSSDLIAHQRDTMVRSRMCAVSVEKPLATNMLMQHLKNPHWRRPYKCSECGKAFRQGLPSSDIGRFTLERP